MSREAILRIYEETRSFKEDLIESGDLSKATTLESLHAKALLLSAASHFKSLVHGDFSTFSLDLTADEIIRYFKKAEAFAACLEGYFDEFIKSEI